MRYNREERPSFLSGLPNIVWELKRRFSNVRRQEFPGASPFVSGDDFRNLSDFVFDDLGLTFLPSQVFAGALVFVKAYPSLVDYFFRQIHPRIRHPYRLLTHNGDYSLPGEHEARLEDPKLLHWYTTNLTCRHAKASAIPIGILNQRANSDNHRDLTELMDRRSPKADRAYLNFHIGGPTEKAEYKAHRQAIHDRFAECSWVTNASRVPPRQYLEEMESHRFIISPPGHGPDCYRHWETMYLGSIPVAERSVSMNCFADFPMILVDDWADVSFEFLQQEAAKISARPFQRSRLFFEFWKDLPASC